jgi:hypothetical protein
MKMLDERDGTEYNESKGDKERMLTPLEIPAGHYF